MTEDAIERLLVVAALALKVECKPEWRDGSTPTVYESSGATLARRIRAKPEDVADARSLEMPQPDAATGATFCWEVRLKAGAARRTLYVAWLNESPQEVDSIVAARRERERLRRSLPHDQRKKAPWGSL